MNDATAHDGQYADWLPAIIACLAMTACVASIWAAGRRLRTGRPLVEPLPHTTPQWRGGDVVIVVLIHLAALLVAARISDAGPDAAGSTPISPSRILAAAAGMAVSTVVSAAFLVLGGASIASLGFRSLRPRDDIRLAIVTLAAITPPLLVVAGCLDRIVPYRHPVVDLLVAGWDGSTLLAVVLSAVVVAPIAEEFFFRRVLQGWLEGVESRASDGVGRAPHGVWPVAVSSVLFALAHLEHGLGWIPLLGFGGAVGWLARQRGSLVPGIIVHALFNAISVGLLLLQSPTGRV